MIVQSVSINGTPANSGIGKTSVVPQSAIKFGGNQTPHCAPRATFMSGLGNKAKALAMTLGLAAPLTFAGCDGTELPPEVESSTYVSTAQQPDGETTIKVNHGAVPGQPAAPIEAKHGAIPGQPIAPIEAKHGAIPGQPVAPIEADHGAIHEQPAVPIKAQILDEAGEAVKMIDQEGNTVSLKIIGKGKKAVAKVAKEIHYLA